MPGVVDTSQLPRFAQAPISGFTPVAAPPETPAVTSWGVNLLNKLYGGGAPAAPAPAAAPAAPVAAPAAAPVAAGPEPLSRAIMADPGRSFATAASDFGQGNIARGVGGLARGAVGLPGVPVGMAGEAVRVTAPVVGSAIANMARGFVGLPNPSPAAPAAAPAAAPVVTPAPAAAAAPAADPRASLWAKGAPVPPGSVPVLPGEPGYPTSRGATTAAPARSSSLPFEPQGGSGGRLSRADAYALLGAAQPRQTPAEVAQGQLIGIHATGFQNDIAKIQATYHDLMDKAKTPEEVARLQAKGQAELDAKSTDFAKVLMQLGGVDLVKYYEAQQLMGHGAPSTGN